MPAISSRERSSGRLSGSISGSRSAVAMSRTCWPNVVSFETIRRWIIKFGPAFARNLRRLRPRPTDIWHLDEMVVSIQGNRMSLWRAVNQEGEILDALVQPKWDKAAAMRLMRRLLKKQGFAPTVLVTDKLASCSAARRQLPMSARHEQGLCKNSKRCSGPTLHSHV